MMKKYILVPFLLVVSLLVNANSPYDTKEKVINRAKAIVAYHVVAKKDGEFTKNPLTEKPGDVDALKKLIKNNSNSKYDKICEEIKKLDDDASDKASLIDLFKNFLIDKGVKDDNALEQIKTVINGSDYPFEEGEEENDADEEDHKEKKASPPPPNKGRVFSGDSIEDKERIIERNDRHNRSEGLSPILPLAVLIIALLGSLFLCFQLWRKNQVLEEEKNKTVKELSPIASGYAKKSLQQLAHAVFINYNKIVGEKKSLEKELAKLNEQLNTMEESRSGYHGSGYNDGGSGYNDAKSHETEYEDSNSPTLSWDIEKENTERLLHETVVIPEEVSVVGKEMFLYLPNDNMFKEGSEEYRSGKTLYKMTYTSDETADFEFVNRPETLAFAKQSRSRFLESACVIENDDTISFNSIQTIEKGKLTKADEGWNIISKARIRLS